jgi:tetratricopeptide (TPR) repeat protein
MLTHAAPPADPLTLPERLANAAVSCVVYLGQLFVPVGLSPFYSYPEAGWPAWQVAAAVALLLTITAAAVVGRRSYPYFFVGWFWYIGMLVPVLGLTHAWLHARADRYTYLSQVGLYLALVWGAMRLLDSWPARRWAFGVGAALVLAALMAGTWRQTGYWQDDQTLWARALACDPKSATAHCGLGAALEKKDDRGAAAQYRQALEMEPGEPDIYKTVRVKAHCGLGSIALRAGDIAEAIAQYEQALALDPNFTIAHLNLGGLLATQGKFDQAIFHFRRSVELQPGNAPIYYSLAIALAGNGQKDEAIANLHKALAIDPSFSPAKQSLQYLSNH